MSMKPSGPGAEATPPLNRPGGPVHVAVVHSGGRICHVVADTSREGLDRQLAAYVEHAAGYQLWPRDGERVASLLARGHFGQAVALYFARTGERWDREQLEVRPVYLPAGSSPQGGAASWPG